MNNSDQANVLEGATTQNTEEERRQGLENDESTGNAIIYGIQESKTHEDTPAIRQKQIMEFNPLLALMGNSDATRRPRLPRLKENHNTKHIIAKIN